MTPEQRLIVALDRSDRGEILQLVEGLEGAVSFFKIGLQAFTANGPAIVREIQERKAQVFLDLKLHDIPNTVAHAVRAASALDADLVTIHAAGGPAMMAAAAEAAGDGKTKVLAVTVLTSLGAADLQAIGMKGSVEQSVVNLASLASRCAVHGVIASPLEVAAIRDLCGPDFLIVAPGIRSPEDPGADQVRTTTAAKALGDGADYIVVGRPITDAAWPRDAALRILESIRK